MATTDDIDRQELEVLHQMRKTTTEAKTAFEQQYGRLSEEVRAVLFELYPDAWSEAAQEQTGPIEGTVEYRDALAVSQAERERIILILTSKTQVMGDRHWLTNLLTP